MWLTLLAFILISVTDMATEARREFRAQPGPQYQFLKSTADITIGGGGAGGGKTWALLFQPIKHVRVPGFSTLILRREYPQITSPGGLWDKSWDLYPYAGGTPREGYLDWSFPSGARIKFGHLQRKDDVRAYDGSEIPLICFDQLESFEWSQFLYLLSRNRSTCGVRPYIRATCNPDPDHPLRQFLAWWIDPETGLAIPERSGIVRWFVNQQDEIIWGDTREELVTRFGYGCMPKSATFIPSSVYDNKILLEKDPAYLANLQAMCHVERMRLLGGNWNIRYTAGSYFKREWFKVVDAPPTGTRDVRYWDRAATSSDKANQRGSWTVGIRMRRTTVNQFVVLDEVRFQGSPLEVEQAIRNTATQDGPSVSVYVEQDPGQAGKAEAEYHIRNLAGFDAHANAVRESKGVRARPLSAQAEAGNVMLVRGPWNDGYLKELENFDGSDRCMADRVDASSGAFMKLTGTREARAY